jgi:hypothetical protein
VSVAVTVAMSWLSLKTLHLDALRETDRAETEMARREAELQERVSSALYRMDLKMLPLVAQEAARPAYLYQSFYDIDAADGLIASPFVQAAAIESSLHFPSPLLFRSSDSVLLHFQIDIDNKITSPQFPQGDDRTTAIADYQLDESTLQQTPHKSNGHNNYSIIKLFYRRALPWSVWHTSHRALPLKIQSRRW